MLATLIASIASGEALLAVRRAKVSIVVYAVVGVLALCGLGFLLVGAYLAAAVRFGTIEAAVGLGLLFLALALTVFVVYRLTERGRRRRAAERRKGEFATAAAATALALLPALASRGAGVSLLVAPLLAMMGYRIYRENVQDAAESADDTERDPEA